jgi:sterol desaturase/sphingolipid hydroxylase (fatty acid hydroxylase superfamily)
MSCSREGKGKKLKLHDARKTLVEFRSFWLYPALGIVLLYSTSGYESRTLYPDLLWLFPLGALIWTLLEYGLHRFVFHFRSAALNRRLRDILNESHLEHHAAPRDASKLLVSTSYGMVVSAVLFAVFYAVSQSLTAATVVMSGIWTGFLYYEAVHYLVHSSPSKSALIARQRRLHFYHHFKNTRRCFGVTSPLWDYVFGTARPARRVEE